MITCNGLLGLSLLVGAARRHVAVFSFEGTGGAFATVAMIATLSLVLPSFTTSRPGPQFSPAQLAFAAVASLALYALFVTVQTAATVTTSCRSPRPARSSTPRNTSTRRPAAPP